MRKYIIILVGALCAVGCGFLFYKAATDDYMKERTYACKVLVKIDSTTHHSSRYYTLVLETEGKKFSLDVDVTTWAICKEGDTLFFHIAPL